MVYSNNREQPRNKGQLKSSASVDTGTTHEKSKGRNYAGVKAASTGASIGNGYHNASVSMANNGRVKSNTVFEERDCLDFASRKEVLYARETAPTPHADWYRGSPHNPSPYYS